jgi:hypothetical protein
MARFFEQKLNGSLFYQHVGDSKISVIKVGVFHVMESVISNGCQSDYGTGPTSIFAAQAS